METGLRSAGMRSRSKLHGAAASIEVETAVADIAARLSPRAGGFIVTLYGDVVEPRGLPLWMGNIIEICGTVGISETLVRTAVSRLVSAGRLVGDRQGRRSYYRLTDEARLEFAGAARVLFEPHDATAWRLVWLPPEKASTLGPPLEKAGFSRLGGSWLLGPSHEGPNLSEALVFDTAPTAPGMLQEMVAAQWDLASCEGAYAAFLSLFEPLREALPDDAVLDDRICLRLRLMLVHAYRLAALRDPHLPREALPAAWNGARARALFAELYLKLSPGADRRAATLLSIDGALPRETEIVRRRRAALLASS